MDSQFPQNPQNPSDPQEPFETIRADASTNGNAWLTPATLPAASTAAGAGGAPIYDLRPLTTGEVLDRTFSVYRSRFWLFAGIAAVSGAVQLVAAAGQMIFQRFDSRGGLFTWHMNTAGILVTAVADLLFFLAYSLTQAATAFAVSEVYLGRETTIGDSLRATVGRWLAYFGIALWQLGSLIWVPALIVAPAVFLLATKNAGLMVAGSLLLLLGTTGGVATGIIFLLRNSMAVPATVVEKLKVRASMRRSKVLAAGAKGRLFLVGLISYCLYMVVGVVQAPLALMVLLAMRRGHESVGAQAGTLLIGFLGHSLVTPVAMIGFTLVYFDQRVRKEAFDIAVLLGKEQAVAGVPAVETTPVVSAPVGGHTDDGLAL